MELKQLNHTYNNSFSENSQYWLEITPLSSRLRVSSSFPGNPNPKKRDIIRGFSSASRRRLIRFLLALEKPPEVMVTLTYPEQWPDDPRIWKRHLDRWLKRVRRKFPDYWFVWKLEFQKRGAPHFHLLGSFGKGVVVNQALKQWVSRSWYEVVDSGDEKHLRAGTNVELLDTNRKIRIYVSKYVSKEDALDMPVGRWWGKSGNVPAVLKLVVNLEYKEWVLIRRIAKRWIKGEVRRRFEEWKQIPWYKRGSYYRGFKFWKWVKKFYRQGFSLMLDMLDMIKMLKWVCPWVVELIQVRPPDGIKVCI